MAKPDYTEGIKKDVVEVKFLIHDLRVERFINEVIHFHVTLNTDLELHGVDQAQILHGHDLQVLKEKAVSLRKAYQDYSNSVKNFSPDRTVLFAGRRYVETIYSACELMLSPLWGRVDKVLTFLPQDSRSAKGRTHYLNCIHWIRGVHQRIQQFIDEQTRKGSSEEFDIASEIEDFTRDVAYGYVMEHSGGRVQIELDRLDSTVVRGSLPRFRRMYFNLVMNAVDAMSKQDVGVLTVSDSIEGDRVVLRVRDNGAGMSPEKIRLLLTDRDTLDGELHSLGFVFVRQTVSQFGGEISIESELGKGTTMTIRFPHFKGKQSALSSPQDPASYPAPRVVGPLGVRPIGFAEPGYGLQESSRPAAVMVEPSPPKPVRGKDYGKLLLADYEKSEADHPGVIFSISVTEEGETDCFQHAPYEKYWDIVHEDLSPMFFEAVVRGRMEPDELKNPILTLKAPQSVREYFEFKQVPEARRSHDLYIKMVHDEYIRVARKLIETGMPPETGVLLDRLQMFFPQETSMTEPFPLSLLASTKLSIDD